MVWLGGQAAGECSQISQLTLFQEGWAHLRNYTIQDVTDLGRGSTQDCVDQVVVKPGIVAVAKLDHAETDRG